MTFVVLLRHVVECDCDPIGSEHGGECDSRTDPVHGFVAGRCICKRYVEGSRCDVCVDHFWNLKLENPDGCEGIYGQFSCSFYLADFLTLKPPEPTILGYIAQSYKVSGGLRVNSFKIYTCKAIV